LCGLGGGPHLKHVEQARLLFARRRLDRYPTIHLCKKGG
jgi:hypothetical protein